MVHLGFVTHFGHRNILKKFCPNTRFGKDEHEMNRLMIAKWQQQVAPEDTVYMLGDVFFCREPEAISIINQLPGNKGLIYGNHDKVIYNSPELQSKFVSIQDYAEIDVKGTRVVLFHFPIAEWNKMHRGAFHLFGHVHGGHDNHELVKTSRMMDVGIDARPDGEMPYHGEMALWGWDQIYNILSKRPIRKHHDRQGDL